MLRIRKAGHRAGHERAVASRCEKERDPIPIFPRGASFHSFLSRLRHPGHKLTKWPAILDIPRPRLPTDRRRRASRAKIMPAFCAISRAHGSFEIGRGQGRPHEPLLHAFVEKGALRVETDPRAQVQWTRQRRRLRLRRRRRRSIRPGGRVGRERAGSGQATRNPFKSPSDFSFRTPHCRHQRHHRHHHHHRRHHRVTVLCRR